MIFQLIIGIALILAFIPCKRTIKYVIKYNYKTNMYEVHRKTTFTTFQDFMTYEIVTYTNVYFTFKDDAQDFINSI